MHVVYMATLKEERGEREGGAPLQPPSATSSTPLQPPSATSCSIDQVSISFSFQTH